MEDQEGMSSLWKYTCLRVSVHERKFGQTIMVVGDTEAISPGTIDGEYFYADIPKSLLSADIKGGFPIDGEIIAILIWQSRIRLSAVYKVWYPNPADHENGIILYDARANSENKAWEMLDLGQYAYILNAAKP